MPNSAIDDHCEFAIQFLLSRQGPARGLAVALARRAPQLPALELIFLMSLAVSSIEEVLAGAEMLEIATDAWRITALIGVELHMMQRHGLPHFSCADLLDYWHTVDDFFLS